jgi:soluble lytic murein transglycosylase
LIFHRWHFSGVLALLIVSCCWFPVAHATSQSSTPAQQSSKKKSAKKNASSKRKRSSPRLRRMRQAFVASTTLKPMARQLLQDRTPVAYAGVETYARRHMKDDAGALAWLVLGYCRVLDRDYPKAIAALTRAGASAGDFGDYVDFYLGMAYQQAGQAAQAIAALSSFDKSFPRSLLVRDAQVLYAEALLANGRSKEAADLLENNRQPVRADLEYVLGRAYEGAGSAAKAAGIFRNIYYTMPLASEAGEAQAELRKLSVALPPIPLAVRRTRADLLAKGKQYAEAEAEYRDLLDEVSPADRPGLKLAMVEAMRRGGRGRDAKKVLESVPTSPLEINAQRLFELGEIERGADDDDAFLRNLDQLRLAAPSSQWLEQALLSAGNIYLLRRDYDHAIDSYRECQVRFPNGSRADYAHWKVAWLSLRQGRNAEARKMLDEQIALYPSSGEVPAALYWRARLAEEDNDSAMARAYYETASLRFRNFYYGVLARQRLAQIKAESASQHYALLDRVTPLDNGTKITDDPLPADNLRIQKAELLANGALLDFAARELKGAAEEEKGNWLAPELVRMYQDAGRYDMAIEVLKRTAPNYFAVDLPSMPRSYWEGLFPKPYWYDLKRFSASRGLDPYLVASLIRQESEFNPNAVSRANAVGLMQLLPKVGSAVARQESLRHFTTSQLFTPAINLQLGTRYFRSDVDKFGAVEYALAAYNAGTDRVDEWLAAGKYRDPQEFVESIPFTETREYVQAILRNANLYRQLYGAP